MNFYGETSSFLHSTGTDRMWVTWQLNSEKVNERIHGETPHDPSLVDVQAIVTMNEQQEPVEREAGWFTQRCVDIPSDINNVITDNPELGLRWPSGNTKRLQHRVGGRVYRLVIHLVKRDSISCGRYLLTKPLSTLFEPETLCRNGLPGRLPVTL